MAVTVEAATNQIYNSGNTNPITFSYAMVNGSAGTGRALVVAMSGANDGSGTYNGESLANLETLASPSGRLYFIGDADLPTDTSAHDLEFTFGGNRNNVDILILELSGVDQITPGSYNTAGASVNNTDPHTLSITPDADLADLFLFYLRVENRTMVSEPSGTSLFSTDTGTLNDAKRITRVVGPNPAALTTR